MKKNNRNGFFLSETMIVMAIVAVVLLGVFKLFSSVYTKYKESENYNTIIAINALSAINEYYKSEGFNTQELLGDNYYIDLTNHATYQNTYYSSLKTKLNVNKIYLMDFDRVFESANINTFNISLRKYLKNNRSSQYNLKLVIVVNDNEYANMDIKPTTPPVLIGYEDDEYSVIVPVGGTFTDPGYTNWNGGIPITTWETPLDTDVPGVYYLNYDFDGYITRRKVIVGQTVFDYVYTGDYQEFEVPATGWYQIEAWGAQGGTNIINASYDNAFVGGQGGYTEGKIYLVEGEKLYVYVGEQGANGVAGQIVSGGYNGGGNGDYDHIDDEAAGAGGGATDIRTESGTWNDEASLNSRIMTAGGGGGAAYGINGGIGGGLIGGKTTYSAAGSQTSGYLFGVGAPGIYTDSNVDVAGGGGGYYGGFANSSGAANTYNTSGAGGSSFISGYAGVNAIDEFGEHVNDTSHYSEKYFIDGEMQEGVNSGNGKAKITYIGSTKPERINTKLNQVQYIMDCTTYSTENAGNFVAEIQAIESGSNKALHLVPTELHGYAQYDATDNAYTNATDGLFDNITGSSGFAYSYASNNNRFCLKIDLGSKMDLDEVAVWHYWKDGRTFYSNTTYVSDTGATGSWVPIIATEEAETSQGKRINAYEESDTVVPIYRVTNLITNGNFSNGTTGWGVSVGATYSASGGVLTSTATARYGGIYQLISNYTSLRGHTLYSSEDANFPSTSIYMVGFNDTVKESRGQTTIINEWTKLSARGVVDSAATNVYFKLSEDARTSGWTANYTKNPLLIDLTKTFGAGKEPSKEWCDANLDYFDGTKTKYYNYSP